MVLFLNWRVVDNPQSYVLTVAMNQLRRYIDKARRHSLTVARIAATHATAPTTTVDESYTETREVVKLLNRLPYAQRKIMCRLYEGQSINEIADATQLRVETVRSHLRNARARLRELV
jgi:RNA polymerase sigma factor (sigma-70 family)